MSLPAGPRLVAAMLAVAALGAAGKEPDAKPRISELRAVVASRGYQVSYKLDYAFSGDALDLVHDGVPLTFRHRVELVGGRLGPLLPRKILGRTIVETTVRYDTLTRRYDVARDVRGKLWPEQQPTPRQHERRRVGTLEEAEAWMTQVRDVPLPSTDIRPASGLRVRVRSELGHRFLLFVFPSTISAAGELRLDD